MNKLGAKLRASLDAEATRIYGGVVYVRFGQDH